MLDLAKKAKKLGATEFGRSSVKLKRFYVIYNNKKINFGSRTGHTFYDHGDKTIKSNWYARHSKIQDADGKFVINDKNSPSYWSANLLW